jgi:hypothetical protein
MTNEPSEFRRIPGAEAVDLIKSALQGRRIGLGCRRWIVPSFLFRWGERGCVMWDYRVYVQLVLTDCRNQIWLACLQAAETLMLSESMDCVSTGPSSMPSGMIGAVLICYKSSQDEALSGLTGP